MSVWHDFRLALRAVGRNPGFSAAVVATVALGIGAQTAVFTVFHATLVQPLPYEDPERLVHLWQISPRQDFQQREASYPDYLDWKSRSSSFSDLAGYAGAGFTVLGGGPPERISASRATPNFFSMLGVRPLLGRFFLPGEEGAEDRVVILTHGYWERRFGGDPAVVGRSLSLDGRPYDVVGVLPPGFEFALRGGSEAWVPLAPSEDQRARRSFHWLHVVGRLKPEAGLERARAEMQAIAARLAAEHPESNAGTGIRVVPLQEEITASVRPVLVALMTAVSLVLLVACVNVAGLMLARGAAREREIATRVALGAGRGRLVRQLLVESLLLASMGGAVGMLWAAWGVDALIGAIPRFLLRFSMPYLAGLSPNPTVLGVALLLTIATGVLSSLVPALRGARVDPQLALRRGGRAAGGSPTGLRRALVVAQLGLALVLLVGAGLVLRSLDRLLAVPLGFDPERLLTLRVLLPAAAYPEPSQQTAFARELRRRVEALPGVRGMASTSSFPLTNDGGTNLVTVEGAPAPPGHEPEAATRVISPSYLEVMGVPVLEGRGFSEGERREAPGRVLVNREFVRRYVSDGRALGRRLTFLADGGVRVIAGVVEDVRLGSLDLPARPTIYVSSEEDPIRFVGIVVRTVGDPGAMLGAVREQVHALDAELPVFLIHTMDELLAQAPSVFRRRYLGLLLGVLAAAAVALTATGLYGVISFQVARRTHEIGVRIALGADRGRILRLVLGQGLALCALGTALGVVAALALGRLITSLLYGVTPTDLPTYASVVILLTGVTVLACWAPALRASRVEPGVALRWE